MTLGGTAPMKFGKFYGWFEWYWNYTSQIENRYRSFEVFIKIHFLYEELKKEWKKMIVVLRNVTEFVGV